MPRAVFYLIGGGESAREAFLLNFLEQKILGRGWKTLIITAPGEGDMLDERLWAARPGNFIPHARANAFNADDDTPVLIAESGEDAPGADVLILWGGDAPDDCSAFGHLVIAPPDDDTLRQQKAMFADRGCEINIHKIGR